MMYGSLSFDGCCGWGQQTNKLCDLPASGSATVRVCGRLVCWRGVCWVSWTMDGDCSPTHSWVVECRCSLAVITDSLPRIAANCGDCGQVGSAFRGFFLPRSSSSPYVYLFCVAGRSTFRRVRWRQLNMLLACARHQQGRRRQFSHDRHRQPIGPSYNNTLLFVAVARAEPGTGGHGIERVITGIGSRVRVRRHTAPAGVPRPTRIPVRQMSPSTGISQWLSASRELIGSGSRRRRLRRMGRRRCN